MFTVYLIVFVIFLIFVFGMSIGLIFLKRPISGSCGGLDSAGIIKACGCSDSCRNIDLTPTKNKKIKDPSELK